MNKIQEKMQENTTLNTASNIAEFVNIFKEDISESIYDIVDGLILSEKFDTDSIKDYIESNLGDKNEDHYNFLLRKDHSFVELFLNKSMVEYFEILLMKSNKLAIFYSDFYNIDEVSKYQFFTSQLENTQIEGVLNNQVLTINDSRLNTLYTVLGLSYNIDKELKFYQDTGIEDEIEVLIMIREKITLSLKPTPSKLEAIFDDVSEFFTTITKNVMENTAKVAVTGTLVLGVSMAAAMAGDGGFDQKKISDIENKLAGLQSNVQNEIGGDCSFNMTIVDSHTIKLTLGDEEKVIKKVEVGNKYNSFSQTTTLSSKTGKCGGLAGSEKFGQSKDRATAAVKGLL